jgi:NDP-sugar pyrophosphorylase family protein
MNLDTCFILAAGFGTRMGDIGKILPKVLWPIFEKSLLELQIIYARSLGFKKIYINIHHQKEIILDFFSDKKEYSDINFLVEDDILDIGGGIQNLAKKLNYNGHIYIINSDQFLLIDKFILEKAKKFVQESVANLFLIEVNSNDKYNAVNFSDNKMINIIQNKNLDRNQKIWTYSGNSVVNLAMLDKIDGKTNFFDSVANFKSKNVTIQKLNDVQYWDFGTKELYFQNMFKILRSKDDIFYNFLIKAKGLDVSKIKNTSYHSNVDQLINLNNDSYSGISTNSIFISGFPSLPINNSIFFKDINQAL